MLDHTGFCSRREGTNIAVLTPLMKPSWCRSMCQNFADTSPSSYPPGWIQLEKSANLSSPDRLQNTDFTIGLESAGDRLPLKLVWLLHLLQSGDPEKDKQGRRNNQVEGVRNWFQHFKTHKREIHRQTSRCNFLIIKATLAVYLMRCLLLVSSLVWKHVRPLLSTLE